MRKFVYIIGVVLLAGCSGGQEDFLASGPIRFVAANYSSDELGTKAAFTDDAFHVNAWTSTSARYFNDVAVTKDGSVWTTADGYGWPKSDKLRFVATHGRISGSPWATINNACTTLSTGGQITVKPKPVDSLDTQLLYTDRTAAYDFQSAAVPLTFRNAMAAVSANIRLRRFDDAVQKQDPSAPASLDNLYRKYDIYTDTTSAGYASHTVYYVIPFGITPNGVQADGTKPYPLEVRLKKPITHIWTMNMMECEAVNVADVGSLSMTLNSDGTWKKPTDGVWVVPETSAAHSSSVVLYNAETESEAQGTPIPANTIDFTSNFADDYRVIPQDLNWSPISTINNQKADVKIKVKVHHADVTKDGIFDFRDVFQWETKAGHTVTSVATAALYGGEQFKQWVEWDGTGVKMLKHIHDESLKYGLNVTFSKEITGLSPHFYDLKSTIDLAKLPGAPQGWGMNTRTSYTIVVDPVTAELTWSPQVTTWEDLGSFEAKEVKQ